MIATFEKYVEVKRDYDGSTEIFMFNEKKKEDQSFFVIPENGNIMTDGYLNPFVQLFKGCKVMVEQEPQAIVRVQKLLPKKRKFITGNYTERSFALVCIGNKRDTTHLPAGLIFQLQQI